MIARHFAQRYIDGLNGIGRIDDPANVLWCLSPAKSWKAASRQVLPCDYSA